MFKIPLSICLVIILASTFKVSAQSSANQNDSLQTISNKIFYAGFYKHQNIKRDPVSLRLPKLSYQFYDLKSYYTQGRFAAMPFNEWGPYQVPYYVSNQKIIVVKQSR